MTDAFAFLAARRSHPAKLLTLPVPDRAGLTAILTAALRVPDHGKLEPWRMIVLERAALARLADLVATLGQEAGTAPEQVAKGRGQFDAASLAVVVVASPRDSPKIPVMEQTLSAGALCVGVVNAAHAAGWGACWLTVHPPMTAASWTGGWALRRRNGSRASSTSAPSAPCPPTAPAPTWPGS